MKLLYNFVLVSTTPQHESVIIICILLPFWASFPSSHPAPLGSHQAGLPVLFSNFPRSVSHVWCAHVIPTICVTHVLCTCHSHDLCYTCAVHMSFPRSVSHVWCAHVIPTICVTRVVCTCQYLSSLHPTLTLPCIVISLFSTRSFSIIFLDSMCMC